MTGRRRRLVRLLAGGVLAVLLAGCVSLPDGSSVTLAKGGGVDRQRQLQLSFPAGPYPGEPQREIIDGYLSAMLAFPSDPTLVREFMTPIAAGRWDPDASLQVYEDPLLTVGPGTKGAVLKATVLGSVDKRGSWSSADLPNLTQQVVMIKVDGEWRIANPLPGTLIDTYFFNLYYHQYSLYFFDATFTLLAPDPVYLQVGPPSATATALVRDLLAGPTSDMSGVVRSAAPAPTRLSPPRVSVSSNGYAVVPLTGNVAGLPVGQIRNLATQLAWTLRQPLVGVNHIRITVNGRPVVVQTAGSVFSVEKFQDPTITAGSELLYALNAKGRLYTVTRDGAFPASGPMGQVTTQARSVAVNGPAGAAALVSEDGTKVIAGSPTLTPSANPSKVWFRGGTNLLRPCWDASGLLWLIDRRPTGAVLIVANGSTHSIVDAPGIEGDDVRAFAISRDGMRLAAVIGRGDSSRLVVALIKRTANTQHLTDVSLQPAQPITNSDFPLSNIKGLAWANSTTVVVLAQDGSSQSSPYEVSIDGSHVQASNGFLPAGTVSVAAGAGSGVPEVIGSESGRLYYETQPPDPQWAPLSTTPKLYAPAYPS